MFESHFGLRENPFTSGHQSRFVYPSPEHQEALAHLRYGIENLEPFVLITGEVGTGKTTALFEALAELQARVSVALITNSALTRDELIEEICLRFGVIVPPPATKPQAMAQLERHLLALRGRGERAILLLDEAQNFGRELLEEIRLLSNLEVSGEKLIQIFLVGQPELEARLSGPELRQLRQRIGVHYRLRPLNLEETARYIHHRISVAGGDAPRVFPTEACAEVHAVTNGIPREINQVCAQALLDAYVDGAPSVTPRHVRSAAQETAFQSVLPASETDPRLPPLPSWPAAVPPPPLAAPPEPAAPRTGTEASRWETWVSSLAKTPEEAGAEPEPPAPEALTLEEVQKIESPREPEPPTRPPAPEPPLAAGPPSAAEPPLAGPGTRYAAESALEPSAADVHHVQDWRPPLWTPESSTAGPRRSAPPPRRTYDRMRLPEPEAPSHTMLKVLIGIAVVAVVAISAVLMFRFGPFAKHPKPVPPPEATHLTDTLPAIPNDSTDAQLGMESAPADSSLASLPTTIPPATSLTAQAKAPATAAAQAPAPLATRPAAAKPPASATAKPALTMPPSTRMTANPALAATPKTILTAKPTAAAPAAPVTTREFGIVVGTFLDRARAQSEIARIGGASGLTGRLAEVQREGATMFAVIIGAYPDRASADRNAAELVSRGTVDEARIISRTVSARP